MPAGCDFICKNENCKQKNSGFVLTAPWPMGKIELIISSLSSKKNAIDVYKKIIEYKNDGRKYACITFPNTDNIIIEAYRIQLWSPEAKCIWQYDIQTDGKPLEEILQNSELPKKCPKTNCNLLNFVEATKEGINCPSCGEKLFQSRWFTNETN